MALRLLRVFMMGVVVGGLSFQGFSVELSQARAAESADVYVNVFLAGGFPDVQGMTLAGQEVSRVNASNQVGGGVGWGI